MLIFKSILLLAWYCNITLKVSAENELDSASLKKIYADRLKAIVKSNSEKLSVLKAFALLDSKSLLRSNEDPKQDRTLGLVLYDGSASYDPLHSSLSDTELSDEAYGQGSSRSSKSKDKPLSTSSESSDSNESLFRDETAISNLGNVLRNWRGSCDKKAIKVCKKACKSASKQACSLYKCGKGLKKAFKRECNSACKRRFSSGKGGSKSDESDW